LMRSLGSSSRIRMR
jgi:hypothetical protein